MTDACGWGDDDLDMPGGSPLDIPVACLVHPLWPQYVFERDNCKSIEELLAVRDRFQRMGIPLVGNG